jgi:hypothetical protein
MRTLARPCNRSAEWRELAHGKGTAQRHFGFSCFVRSSLLSGCGNRNA